MRVDSFDNSNFLLQLRNTKAYDVNKQQKEQSDIVHTAENENSGRTDEVFLSSIESEDSSEVQRNRNEVQNYSYDHLREQVENAKAQGDATGDMIKERIKCMQIAMRIMNGDIVPKEDHRYLAEKDIDLYGRAMSMRMEKEKPKKYDRISEDEEENKVNQADNLADSEGIALESAAIEPEVQTEIQTEVPTECLENLE